MNGGTLVTMPEVGVNVAEKAGMRNKTNAAVLDGGATGRSSNSSGGDGGGGGESKRGDLQRERTTEQSAANTAAIYSSSQQCPTICCCWSRPSLAHPSSAIVAIWCVLAAVLRCLLWLSFPWLGLLASLSQPVNRALAQTARAM